MNQKIRCNDINHKIFNIMKNFILGIVLTASCASTSFAQDFGNIFKNVASEVYVHERFTNPGQFGILPLAGPYFPINNLIATTDIMIGGDFDNTNTLYVLSTLNGNRTLATVNPSNGVITHLFNVTGTLPNQSITKLSYNFTNDTFYAMAGNPNGTTTTQLYSIDESNGIITPIGAGTGIANGVALEIDNNGIAYAADAVTGNLYTIDLTTGVGTSVGNMIPNGLYPVHSGFSIDHSTNVLYAVMPNSNGVIRSRFYTVNLATAGVTDLGDGSSRRYSLFTIAGGVLGLNDASLASFSIFPNPTNSKITIENLQSLTLKSAVLFDILGKNTGAVLLNNEMNIETLAKGMYLLKLETESGSITKKIIKD